MTELTFTPNLSSAYGLLLAYEERRAILPSLNCINSGDPNISSEKTI
jgi:hypothetical protein